jgi:hypothetical protein
LFVRWPVDVSLPFDKKPGMNSKLQRAFERFKSVLKGRKGTEISLTHNSVGIDIKWLTLENESGEESISWQDIEIVTAFKRDLLTYDILCIQLVTKAGLNFECNEEDPYWGSLVEKLPEYLPGCPLFADWWHPVAIPAFATNETVLFKRESCKSSNQPAT